MKRKSEQTSPFWKPEDKGDSISGIIHGFQETKANDDGTPSFAVIVGETLVGMSHNVRSALVEHYGLNKIKIGKDKLTVTFVEKKKVKGGRSVNVFTVELNGKQLQTSNFKKLSADEVMTRMQMGADSKKSKRK